MRRALPLLVLLPLASLGCGGVAPNTSGMDNTQFAKTAFVGLANGDQGVRDLIDWQVLRVGPTSTAAQYQGLKSDIEKQTFQRTFILSFGNSYRNTGATANSLNNWGQVSDDANWAVVTANPVGSRSVFTFTISKRDNVRRLAAIDLPQPAAPSAPAWQPQPTPFQG